jgi:hypothetical protein
MKKTFFVIFAAVVVLNVHAVDDKIWGFWLYEKGVSGTYSKLEQRREYHLEKMRNIKNDGYFRNRHDFLETHTVVGTMLYPSQGGVFIITDIEEKTSDEYILYMSTVIGSDGAVYIYGDGIVKMVFLDEDTIYFEMLSDNELGTYNHFFTGRGEKKYRAEITDGYYPERAGITRYSERMKQPELETPPTEINLSINEPVQNKDEEISMPMWAWFAIIGGAIVVVGGGTAVFVIRKRK